MSIAIAPRPERRPSRGAPPRAAEPASRMVMFDVARLAAAYSIVWLHTPRSAELVRTSAWGRFAVPFFVVATIFFIWQGAAARPGRSFARYAVSRLERLYLPFLAWSAIYLVFKGAKSAALPDQPNDFPGWEFLWTGSFYHLWFMPFILVVSLAVFLLAQVVVARRGLELVVAGVSLAAGAAIALVPQPGLARDPNLLLIYNALPAVCWGVALAIAFHRGLERSMQSSVAAVLGLLVTATCMVWVWQFGRDNLCENLAGTAFLLVALAPWDRPALRWVARYGPLAYGIYLSHLLFIKSAEAVLAKSGAARSWEVDLGVFLFAAIGSTALAWLLSRSRATRWLAA